MTKAVALALSLSFALASCASRGRIDSSPQIKRSWVRRLVSEGSLYKNDFSQNFSPVVLRNGNILQGTSDGHLYELTAYGRKVWELHVDTPITSNGSVYENFVFFGGQDKKVYAYNRESRSLLWVTSIGESVASVSRFNNGRIFVMSSEGSLYSLDASEGVINWRVNRPSAKLLTIYGAAVPKIYKNSVIAAFPSGSLGAFDLQTGKSLWETQLLGGQKYKDANFTVLTSNDMLFTGTFDEVLYRVDPETGRLLWQAFEKPVGEPQFFEGKLYITGAEGKLTVLQASSGSLLAKKKVFKGLGSPVKAFGSHLISSDSKGPIYLLDKKNLKIVDSYEITSAVSTEIQSDLKGRHFYIFTDGGYLYSFGI